MKLTEIWILGSLSIGAFLSLCGIGLYIWHYRQQDASDQAKGLVRRIIGIVNFCIFFLMLVVLVIMLFFDDNTSTLIEHNLFWLLCAFLILGFVLGQCIYLFIPSSPLHLQIGNLPRRKQPPERTEERRRLFGERYLDRVSADQHLRLLHNIFSGEQRFIEDVYVPVNLYYRKSQRRDHETAEQTRSPREAVQWYNAHQHYGEAVTPEAVLEREPQSYVLLGDPGVGKTTLLRHLALQIADDNSRRINKFPVYIELNIFASRQMGLLEFMIDIISQNYQEDIQETKDFIEYNLQAGRLLLFFDGLDETLVATRERDLRDRYYEVSKAILQLARRYPRTSMIVTSRAVTYDYDQEPILRKFNELVMFGFTEEQDIRRFLEKWLPKDGNVDSLLSMLMERGLRSLASNPLLLQLIAKLYADRRVIPANRTQLYQGVTDALLTNRYSYDSLVYNIYTDTLLDKWDMTRGVIRPGQFGLWEEKQLLQRIAWDSYEKDEYPLSEETIMAAIQSFLSERHNKKLPPKQIAQQRLEEVVTRHGLLKIVQPSLIATYNTKKTYEFLHPSFQEYFAARYVIDNEQPDELLRHLDDPKWDAVLHLYEPDVAYINLLLDKSKYQDIFLTNLMWAGNWIAANPERLASQVVKVTDELFKRLIETRYQFMRERIAQTLVTMGDVKLNQQGGSTIIARLYQLMTEQKESLYHRDIAHSIINALRDNKFQSAVPKLLSILQRQDIDTSVRIGAAHALRMLGRPEQANTLLGLLREPGLDDALGGAIVDALAKLGDDETWAELFDLLYSKLDINIRRRIIVALYRLCKRKTEYIADLRKQVSHPRLESLLHGYLLIALAALDKRDLIKNVLELFYGNDGDLSPGLFVSFLNEIEAYHLLPDLSPLLVNTNVALDVRLAMAELLAKLPREFDGYKYTVNKLASYMTDEQLDLLLRCEITLALGTRNEPDLCEQFMAILSNTSMPLQLRRSCAEAFGNCPDGNETAADLAPIIRRLQYLREQEPAESSLRKSIEITLGKFGDVSAAPALLAMLRISDIQSAHEYTHIQDALENLSKQPQIRVSLLEDLWEYAFSSGVPVKIRDDLIRLIVNTAENKQDYKQACDILFNRLTLDEMTDTLYRVLLTISNRAHLRIYQAVGSKLSFEER